MTITWRSTIAVAAALTLVGSACGTTSDDDPPHQARPTPARSASPTDTGPSGPANPTPAGDRAFAIVRSADASGVVEIDPRTGDIRRTISQEIGEGASSLDVAPATSTLVWSRVVTAARSEILEVPAAGGDAEVIDRGYAVDVSDDGALRVVARRVLREGGGEHVEVEVTRDGARVGLWTAGEGESLSVRPDHFAFSNDGTRLAYDVRYEDGVALFVLELDEAPTSGDLVEASRRIDAGDDDAAMNSRPFWLDDGVFGFVQGCCDLPEFDSWDVVLYDLDEDAIVRTLFTEDRALTDIDVDASGSRLLFTLGHDAFGAAGDPEGPPTLAVWDGGEPREVGEDLRSPTW